MTPNFNKLLKTFLFKEFLWLSFLTDVVYFSQFCKRTLSHESNDGDNELMMFTQYTYIINNYVND